MTPDAESAPRVLLVNLNRYTEPCPVYPVGLAHVAGALRHQGFDTKIWDALFPTQTLEECLASYRPGFVGLALRNVDNVQCQKPRSFIEDLLDFCRRIRSATKAVLVLGGSGFSVFPKELYELTRVDFGVEGEGEESLPRLLSALRSGGRYEDIPGLHYRKPGGAAACVPKAASGCAFDSEPWHDPELLGRYVAAGALPGVQTQRGCPLKCCYCTYPLIEGRRSRYRSGEQVAAEMRRLRDQGVRYAFIVDSVFNTGPEHLRDVCEALIRAKLDLQWECFLRPSRALTRETFEMMKEAGLRHVEFGSDSFSDPVLERFGKSFGYAEIAEASRLASEAGLHYSHFLIFGGPGETPETVEETIRRTREHPDAFYFAALGLRIYPGTPLWRELRPEARGETAESYLAEPRFYLAPGFDAGGLYARLREIRSQSRNWIVGDPPAGYRVVIDMLRKRGVRGPLWEYIELLQRMGPAPEAE